ncbi:DUF6361 family protein [Rhodococcus sp. SORGH_AS_0303]|uniref:DUF6361 family protein n=1 Tax=Rhodococcus sp. SORGH_AS_0303 TaxID=3041753 RepID=UPI0027828CE4|nr:DUF6361 family protein [Rhodococcus sp. SORGH_AS_0303]MDQ1200489.1 hypothetical protein [Rhodococcus sp. SORGH_AS_0303]
MSNIAWLDTSPDEERQMRELVKLFSDNGTLDDIGIGQVRDALTDQLFPATSTVHTRAKYFLLVPWIYEEAARKYTGTSARTKARDAERKLIEAMRQAGHTSGLIGRVAGASVNTLPSNLYWAALKRLNIRLDDPQGVGWNVGPTPPEGFPTRVGNGLDLNQEQASWLQERILSSAPTTYLAHLVRHGLEVDITDVVLPWNHPALSTASDYTKALVDHARLFSLTIHGAGLLYNLLLAEKFDVSEGSTSYVQDYRDALDDWANDVAACRSDIAGWNGHDFWKAVDRGRNTPVPLNTRLFVDSWLTAVRGGSAYDPARSPALRTLVADRERANKGEQSRLNNDRLLRAWSGASGAGRLVYRWPNVQVLVGDIREGLSRAAS